jgi:RHS repeat-associated protein
MQSASNSSTVVSFQYDYMGRRFSKIVEGVSTNFLYYDGWNLIAEKSGGETTYHVWGLDLSGEMQGAGGVGGLLGTYADSAMYFACADGNGNVTDYTDATGTNVVASYVFGAYGDIIDSSGSKVDDFNILFSSKYLDRATAVPGCSGMYCYGYRELWDARFTSRDPIGEDGGVHLYGFVDNDPVANTDMLGLAVVKPDASGNCPKKCCKNKGGKAIQLVAIWHCTRKLGGTGPGKPILNHQYICCSGVNKGCWGVQKYTPSCMKKCKAKGLSDKQCKKKCYAKKGTPIESEVSPTGTCEKRCVLPDEKKTACNGKQKMPRSYHVGPHGIDCQEWAKDMTSTSCK